jgi:hypothetical protein
MSVFVFVSDERVKSVKAKNIHAALRCARELFGHNRFELIG